MSTVVPTITFLAAKLEGVLVEEILSCLAMVPTISFMVTWLDDAFDLKKETTREIVPTGIAGSAITIEVGLIMVNFRVASVIVFYFFKSHTSTTNTSGSGIKVGIASAEEDIISY